MLNHGSPYQALWTYSDLKKGFLMTAEMDIKKDEEIYDSYGKKSSYNFLLHMPSYSKTRMAKTTKMFSHSS